MPNVEDLPEKGAEQLGHKVGPLPLWGWVLILGVGGYVTYVLFFRDSGASAVPTYQATGTPLSGGGGSSGGGGGGTTGTGTTTPDVTNVAKMTNLQWLQKALDTVPQALSVDPTIVRLFLEQYLNGDRPVGSGQALTLYDRIVRSAIENAGQVPNAPNPPNPNRNPYGSNVSWWQNAVGYLPGGTSGQVRQELANLANGTTTSISANAAALLDYLRNTIGVEPTTFNFSVIPLPTPATPTPTPTAPTPTPAAPTPTPSAPTLPTVPNPLPGNTPGPDVSKGWGKTINDMYQALFKRNAAPEEIYRWANVMLARYTSSDELRQMIIDWNIRNSPAPTADVSKGWGQLINDAFKKVLYRNASDSEIYTIADQMKAGTISNDQQLYKAVQDLQTTRTAS